MNYRPSLFPSLTPVVKNLLIINALAFMAQMVLGDQFVTRHLALHYPESSLFNTAQIVTYMFLHAHFYHIFFNMFALFMFGRILEEVWGPKRFLSYYLVTGIGAGLIQFVVAFITIHLAKGNLSADQISLVYSEGLSVLEQSMNYTDKNMATLNIALNGTTIGDSGAVFGILLAFGMLFPNTQLMLLFPPIPLKAKYFVILYGVAELFLGVANFSGDNVAHWAHLGGMLFGFFMIRHWRNKGIY